jgi:hypothetical protein
VKTSNFMLARLTTSHGRPGRKTPRPNASADGPVIFDIGTASLMWGEVLLAAETGVALPPGVAFDADGNPTQDGRAAARGRCRPLLADIKAMEWLSRSRP